MPNISCGVKIAQRKTEKKILIAKPLQLNYTHILQSCIANADLKYSCFIASGQLTVVDPRILVTSF